MPTSCQSTLGSIILCREMRTHPFCSFSLNFFSGIAAISCNFHTAWWCFAVFLLGSGGGFYGEHSVWFSHFLSTSILSYIVIVFTVACDTCDSKMDCFWKKTLCLVILSHDLNLALKVVRSWWVLLLTQERSRSLQNWGLWPLDWISLFSHNGCSVAFFNIWWS